MLNIAQKSFISPLSIKLAQRFTSEKEVKEVIDSYWEVEHKVDNLAHLLEKSKYPIVFTGAGISTSLGIPDYRSGPNTVIKTGPGMWNRDHSTHIQQKKPHQTPIDKLVDLANPSFSHMFISTLLRKDVIKYLVSQNTDGLHLRSGVSLQKISELHGNRNLQHCLDCKRKYNRDFRTLRRDGKVYKPGEKRDHFTGRYCQNCGGQLHDSIVYFGEKLPSDQLAKAYYHASQADLCICVGSSLTVKPSSLVPLKTLSKQPPGKLCILNIQQTPLDSIAQQKINYFCDEVFELLAKKMNIGIDPLIVKHFLQMEVKQKEGQLALILEGKDKENNNLTFMREVKSTIKGVEIVQEIKGHKCEIHLESLEQKITLDISHFGDKKSLTLTVSPLKLSSTSPLTIEYSKVQDGQWKIQKNQ